MKLSIRILILVGLMLSFAGLLHGGTKERPICIPVQGWVTDSESGKAGANPSNTRENVEEVLSRGGTLLFYAEEEDRLYQLADPSTAVKYVGNRLTVEAHVELVIHEYLVEEADREQPGRLDD